MKKRLEGRRILVTGAGSGIGAAIAELFAEEGAELVLLDKAEEGLAAKAKALSALPVCADVTDPAAVQAAVDHAVESHGWSRWFGQRRRHSSSAAIRRHYA